MTDRTNSPSQDAIETARLSNSSASKEVETMPAELTKGEVEELCARCEPVIERAIEYARRYFTIPNVLVSAEAEYADMRALLTLARSAPSEELVKLGEAAVAFAAFDQPTGKVDYELREAARAYARSVEKTVGE